MGTEDGVLWLFLTTSPIEEPSDALLALELESVRTGRAAANRNCQNDDLEYEKRDLAGLRIVLATRGAFRPPFSNTQISTEKFKSRHENLGNQLRHWAATWVGGKGPKLTLLPSDRRKYAWV
jgi:hypothetical protein